MNRSGLTILWFVGEEYHSLQAEFQALLSQWGTGPLEEETILLGDNGSVWAGAAADLRILIGPSGSDGEVPTDLHLPAPTAAQLWSLVMAWKTGLTGDLISSANSPQPLSGSKESQEGGPTAKEALVLQELLSGESNKGIAFNLGLSVSTVKFHLKNLMEKVDAQSRSEVLMEAIRRGWVSL